MTKSELWKLYTNKNPSFAGEGQVTMSAAGLRKLFEQTYDQGYEHGRSVGAALAQVSQGGKGRLDDLFRGMF